MVKCSSIRLRLLGLMLAIFFCRGLVAQTPQDVCTRGTWSNCGVAVKNALDKHPAPKQVVDLALLWGTAYDARFNELRKRGKIESSTPDSEKIFEAVKSKIDPIEVVTDKSVDALVKRYLPRVSTVLEFASGPIGEALKTFFDSSEIATDYDELKLMNDDLQQRIVTQLAPVLKPNWKDLLNNAVQSAGPELRAR